MHPNCELMYARRTRQRCATFSLWSRPRAADVSQKTARVLEGASVATHETAKKARKQSRRAIIVIEGGCAGGCETSSLARKMARSGENARDEGHRPGWLCLGNLCASCVKIELNANTARVRVAWP